MRITQGMMKSPSVISQLKQKTAINAVKKKQTSLQKLMAQKKKVAEQLKNIDKKNLSSSEKNKLAKQLTEQMKQIDEAIRLSKANEKKKPVDKKGTMTDSKQNVAQIRSETFDIMTFGNKSNRINNAMFDNIKGINQAIAMKKVSLYKKTS